MTQHEVFALHLATTTMTRDSRFHRYADRGSDGAAPIDMSFYFWLIRGGGRNVLLDTGFSPDQTAYPHYELETHPVELLARLGLAPEDIDHVILSHFHFDHIGNVELFPNARFTVAHAELDFWTGPLRDKPHLGIGAISDEVRSVQRLVADGRVDLVKDGETEVVPGVRVRPYRGHTPGQLVTEVTTRAGVIVLASDAAHFYEEFHNDLPFWLFADLEGMYRTYESFREAVRHGRTVIAGHDPRDMKDFVQTADGCFDLTRPVRP